MRFPLIATLGIWLLVSSSGTVRAEDAYYLIVFANQRETNLPRYSHTFATFLKVTTSDQGNPPVVEPQTISWLPESMQVQARLLPERGKNLSLPASLKLAKELDARVTAWGPFRIKKELHDSALRRIRQLESGAVAYKMVDVATRPAAASNCIHAVSDLDVTPELLATGTARGESASALVIQHFRPWLIRPEVTHNWLLDELGLNGGSGAKVQVQPLARK